MNDLDLANLCRQSYLEDGVMNADEIGGLAIKCFVTRSAPRALVFRGTADLAGWLEDILAKPIALHGFGQGMAHSGFMECWSAIKRQTEHVVGDSAITITGHSLGGAVATLAAMSFAGQVDRVVTFGSPRVGDATFAASYKERGLVEKTTRYVNESDLVPFVPGLLAGYRHVCPATWFNGREWGTMRWWPWLKMAYKQARGDENFFADHWIDHYIDNVSF